jgi:hypothetical protein
MKLAKMESFFVKPRRHVLKITTDDGYVGWGEPIVEGRARIVAMAVKELEPVLTGRNPLEIEAIWTEVYRGLFIGEARCWSRPCRASIRPSGILRANTTISRCMPSSAAPPANGSVPTPHVHGNTLEETIANAKKSAAEGFTLNSDSLPLLGGSFPQVFPA